MYSRTDILRALPDNFIPIWYNFKFRGNAVQRILSAHPECAWEKDWCASPDPSNVSPLDFPETHDAFVGSEENYNVLGRIEAHAWAHTAFDLHDLDREKIKKFRQAAKTYKEKLVFFSLHPERDSIVGNNKQNVFLYSSQPFTRNFKDKQAPKLVEPIDHSTVFNIDIAKLFSDDYRTFLQEYSQIVDHFKFTLRTNAVRAFILRYLERERHVSTL